MLRLYGSRQLFLWKLHKRCLSTVFALSSGLGKCGVAVIRVSGALAGNALKEVTNLQQMPQARTALLRSIKHPVSKEILDKGLVLWFPGPRSFTGEDCCEFHVHGGVAVVNGVLDALGSLKGLKLAEPGEFTKRAFLNGKLDLTEVEGLSDLLQAETEVQRKQAFLQLHGALSKLYERWKDILKHSVANIEATIDFDETETLESGLVESVLKDIESLSKEIHNHLSDGRKGELLRNGVRTVILGQPNVGKSSLLNILCQRPAAIVTPISGTTRDVIEVTINIGGYPLVLSDTAGLRNCSEDLIEIEGMSRAKEIYKKTDLVILVVDFLEYLNWKNKNQTQNFTSYIKHYCNELGISDLINNDSSDWKKIFTKNCIVVINKIDLDKTNLCDNLEENVIKISCKRKNGIQDFVELLAEQMKILCGEPSQEHPSMSQVRHRQELSDCLNHLELFLKEVSNDSPDLVIMAAYLRKSLTHIGKLIGTVTSKEWLVFTTTHIYFGDSLDYF